ncbi:MAG: TetR/AcrR family transcriptional regulator [Solirubrobacterales bacterium]
MLVEAIRDRRTERHEATKGEILEAAWELARAEGLAAVSLRDIARRVGMQPPSLYSYFDSKNAIYDAMYAQGSQQFVDAEPWAEMNGDPRHDLRHIVHYFVRFCSADVARYQLLFQRTIPGFEPLPESLAISQASLARLGQQLERCGITDGRAIDLFTALGTGLADQQISNDPGGDRWIRLIDDAVEMFFDFMIKTTKRKATAKGRQTK